MNTINGRVLPFNSYYNLPVSKFSEGKILIEFNELQIKSPINFNCLYNGEIFYPNIKWNENNLILDFGIQPNENDKIKIIFIFNT